MINLSYIKDFTDVYSQETFETLKNKNSNRDFYICVVEEVTKKFVFEGSKFIENFLRDKNVLFKNPLTNKAIVSFKVYKSEPDSEDFIKVADEKSAVFPIISLPILANDLDRPPVLRGKYYFQLSECYRVGKGCLPDQEATISYLRDSAALDNTDAQFNLSLLLSEKGLVRESIYWSLKAWKDVPIEEISPKGLIEMGNCFERFSYLQISFCFYQEAAFRGNPHAIAKVIRYNDQGFGRAKNPHQANVWKQFIPYESREKSSADYLSSTCRQELLDITEELLIPEELKTNRLTELPTHLDFPETLI